MSITTNEPRCCRMCWWLARAIRARQDIAHQIKTSTPIDSSKHTSDQESHSKETGWICNNDNCRQKCDLELRPDDSVLTIRIEGLSLFEEEREEDVHEICSTET